MTWTNQRLAGRIPELDGIRGLAILLVLILHYAYEPAAQYARSAWQVQAVLLFRLCWSGVDLFFVLSGFLIGGILLDAKYAANYYRTFYLRRFFRIVPIYALMIVTFIMGLWWVGPNAAKPLAAVFNWRIPLWAYPLFLQNVFMTLRHSYGASWLSATWSLAVEEQFYLLLPFVVRRLSHKGIVGSAIGMIVAAPVLRYLLEHRGFNELAMYTLLPCRADALGFGLLLAIVCRHQTSWTWIVSHRRYVYAVFAVLGFGILTWILLDVTLGYTWMAAFYASLLLLVVANPGRVERRIFRSFALTRLGTVAYALYLFHTGILRLCHYMFFRAVPSIQNLSTLCVTLLALGVVMLCAELSWLVLEKPLIKHARSKFQYAMGRQEANLAAQP